MLNIIMYNIASQYQFVQPRSIFDDPSDRLKSFVKLHNKMDENDPQKNENFLQVSSIFLKTF